VAMDTLASLVSEARAQVLQDAVAAGMDAGASFEQGGVGAAAYADAVAMMLGIAVSRRHHQWTAFSIWDAGGELVKSMVRMSAVPMTWDFGEANPFSGSTGNFLDGVELTVQAIESLGFGVPGTAFQKDARLVEGNASLIVSTDPPYFDNIPYADLSDLFYVWLRRALRPILPIHFSTMLVPKADELVADPARHGGREAAEAFFFTGMRQAMAQIRRIALPCVPVSIYYAFKQSESDAGGVVSTGWDTFLSALVEEGFSIVGTWPIRTEQAGGLRNVGRNSLSTSIVLVCRVRPENAETATRRDLLAALRSELPVAVAYLQRSNIAPVDLAQAAIGPGMGIFSRYAQVLDVDGKRVSVREALGLINRILDEVLAEQEGDFDAETRWALSWFDQHGFSEVSYGDAETLSKAKNVSVSGVVEAGILSSSRGKVRLFQPADLSSQWDPQTAKRVTDWAMVHHAVRALSEGEVAAARLVGKLGGRADVVRELAYRLFTVCERKKRSEEAFSYNSLVRSWPEIVRLARDPLRLERDAQDELSFPVE